MEHLIASLRMKANAMECMAQNMLSSGSKTMAARFQTDANMFNEAALTLEQQQETIEDLRRAPRH